MFKLSIDIVSIFLEKEVFIQNGFITYGDTMQFGIIFALIFLLCFKDFLGIKYLLLSSLIGLGVMLLSKNLLRKTNIDFLLSISKRPITEEYNGFPSGHTTSIFIVAGFAWKRYGYTLGILVCTIGIFVGISRIYAMRHTILQVIAGALLGFFSGYIIAKKRAIY